MTPEEQIAREESMSKTIKITIASKILKEGREIDATPSKSPYFAIHPSELSDAFTITHIPTGYAVTYSCKSIEEAETICDELAAMPMPWGECTPENSKALADKLPKRYQDRLRQIRA